MNEKKKSVKELAKDKLAVLMFLMLMDFIFTYIGVNHLQVITEANPILISLFEMPVIPSLLIRLAHMLCIYAILIYIKKERFKLYAGILNFALILNSVILFMHVHWIFKYAGIL